MARNIVEVHHPVFGDVELNVDRVIAVVPERNELLFEAVRWTLDKDNFDKVYKAWKGE